MAHDEIERFLAVRWYDGLMVRTDHLSHNDVRISSLFSQAIDLLSDQPGLIDIVADPKATGQLVEVAGVRPMDAGDGLTVRLNVLVTFRAITANGSLIVAVPNKDGHSQMPSPDLKANIVGLPQSRTDYLICVGQDLREDLHVEKLNTEGRPIELVYPALRVELFPVEQYRSGPASARGDLLPVALLTVEGDKAEIMPSYIPPVGKLKLVSFFDAGAVDSLGRLLEELCEVSAGYLSIGGYLFTGESVSEELKTRYNYYQVLNAMLLGKFGLLKDLPDLSPTKLMTEIMHPLTRWLDQYYGTAKERQSSLAPLASACYKMRDLSSKDLRIGTDRLLVLSKDFVFKINEAVREVA